MKRCPDMCFKYWSGHPFSALFICPGCETWTDKDGKTWRRINLPDGVEIRPVEVDKGTL